MITLKFFQNAQLNESTFADISAAAQFALNQIESPAGTFPHVIADEYGAVIWHSVSPFSRQFQGCVVELQILAVSVFEVAA